MRKAAVIIGGLALAGCGGVVPVVQSIFDQVNAYTLAHCGYSFTFATIDAITKALSGQLLNWARLLSTGSSSPLRCCSDSFDGSYVWDLCCFWHYAPNHNNGTGARIVSCEMQHYRRPYPSWHGKGYRSAEMLPKRLLH
jgi:hypothetical protein